MPLYKIGVPIKLKQSPAQVSAQIESRMIKCTEPLNLLKSTTAIDCTQDIATRESPIFNQNSKPLAIMGSSHLGDNRSIESRIEDFQQDPKLVYIMEKILEKKKHYILALAQQGAKLPSDFDVINLK